MPTEEPEQGHRGLDAAEAARRLAAEGANTLARDATRRLWTVILGVLREPMFLLLMTCAGIYLTLGDLQEALILLGCVVAVISISVVQTRRTDRAVAALRDLSSPRALVIRDGVERRIAGAEVVRGDLVRLHEGDRVPADGSLLAATNLAVDESLLTGESMPVHKQRAGERVFSGTLVVRGHGLAEIVATGPHSELGKIGASLATLEAAPSRVQREVTRLVRIFSISGALCCAAVLLLFGLGRGAWLEGLLAGVTLAISLLPEEFPLVLTVFLALGAWRLSRQRVLVRRIPALESLGAATTLCVDKTGTLTQNKMTLVALRADGATWSISNDGPLTPGWHALAEHAALASQRETFDPMDEACRRFLAAHAGAEAAHADWERIREYPLTPALLAVTHVWRTPTGATQVASKGAPEAIAGLCRLDEVAREAVRREVAAMADTGLRVLAVARADGPAGALPQEPGEFTFTWLGLLGLQDPPRPEAAAALAECRGAGIRVMMITGDYPGTAQAIGGAVGLSATGLLTGSELATLGDAELAARLKGVEICARVLPDQKLRLVRALQAQGEVVAMTGDGVNDAPALKAAQIGVAMGERGTDVAREAAAIVLTRDDFTDLVAAVAEGRRIFDNLRKALGFIVAVHIPIAGIALVPLLFGLPLLFQPIHIIFLELIIDPACSIVFEAEPAEPGLMRRPPRRHDAPLLDGRTLLLCCLQGLTALAACLVGLYYGQVHLGQPIAVSQTVMFTTLILADIGLIFAHRSTTSSPLGLRIRNRTLWWVVLGSLLMLLTTLLVPAIRDVFHFVAVPGLQLFAWAMLGPLSVLGFELVKRRLRA